MDPAVILEFSSQREKDMTKAKARQRAKANAAKKAQKRKSGAAQPEQKFRPGQFDPGPGSISGPGANTGAKNFAVAKRGSARSN